MTTHDMKLQPLPFEQIRAGTKTLEMRLNDPKRQAIAVGDVLTFFKEPELVESLRVRVIERLPYPTFAALVQQHPPLSLGFEGGTEGYVRPPYYSAEDEARYGALALRIEVMEGY